MGKTSDYKIRLRADNEQLKQKLIETRAKLRNYDKYTKRIGSSVATSMSQVFGIGLGISGFVQLGRSVYETTKRLDALDKAMNAVSDSAEDVANSQAFLKKISEDYGLEIKGLTDSYIAFTAAAKGTGLEGDKSKKVFDAVSKSTAILGLSADDTTRALKAIAQMMSKGKIQAEELRMQLGDRIPGAFNIMARAAGVTTAELDKMLKDGKLIADELLPAFADEMLKTFGADKTEKINTLVAAQGRLTNAWTEFIASLNEGDGVITSTMMGLMGYLGEALQALKAINKLGFETFGVLLKDFSSLTGEQIRTLVDAGMITDTNKKVQDLLKPFVEMPVDQITANFQNVKKSFFDTFEAQGEELTNIQSLWDAYFADISKLPVTVEPAARSRVMLADEVEDFTHLLNLNNKAFEDFDDLMKQFPSSAAEVLEAMHNASGAGLIVPLMELPEENLTGLSAYFEEMNRIYGDGYRQLIKQAEELGMELNATNGEQIEQMVNDMAELTSIAERTLEGALVSLAQSLGTLELENAFSNFFDVFGQGLQQMGAALISQGVALKAAALSWEPATKIAAGIAAVAAGAAISKISAKMAQGVSSGGGAASTGYSGDYSGNIMSGYQAYDLNLNISGTLTGDTRNIVATIDNYRAKDSRRG